MRVVLYFLLSLLIFSSQNVYAKLIVENKKFYVDLGGNIDYKFNHANNEKYFAYKYPNDVSIYSDVYFTSAYNVTSTTTIGYSLKLWTKFDSRSDNFSITDLKMTHAYAFLERQNIGRIEFGAKNTASNNMKITTSSDEFIVANGGVSGHFSEHWINYANLHIYPQARGRRAYYGSSINAFWVKPCLYSEYKWIRSPVISYYSPVISGIQMGISYVPGKSNIDYENLVTGGISYSNKLFDTVDYSFSLTGEFANAKPEEKLNKLGAWNIGFNIRYKNFIYLFSYGNIGKSGHISSHEAEYINTGIACHFNKWKGALTYFGSNKGNYKLSSWGISWEKKLLKNIMYYMDLVAFDAKQPAIESNLGTVFLAGLKFKF